MAIRVSRGARPLEPGIALSHDVDARVAARAAGQGEVQTSVDTPRGPFTVAEGRIAETWGVVDVLSPMRQLGAIPVGVS
jgi:hypothetical protein